MTLLPKYRPLGRWRGIGNPVEHMWIQRTNWGLKQLKFGLELRTMISLGIWAHVQKPHLFFFPGTIVDVWTIPILCWGSLPVCGFYTYLSLGKLLGIVCSYFLGPWNISKWRVDRNLWYHRVGKVFYPTMGMFLCLCFAPCPHPGHSDGKLEYGIFQYMQHRHPQLEGSSFLIRIVYENLPNCDADPVFGLGLGPVMSDPAGKWGNHSLHCTHLTAVESDVLTTQQGPKKIMLVYKPIWLLYIYNILE